jgi:hypothetical protein
VISVIVKFTYTFYSYCMTKEKEIKTEKKIVINKGGGGAVYGLGFLGALVYYLMHATSFWVGVIGVIKAIFWPALLIYQIFDLLKL